MNNIIDINDIKTYPKKIIDSFEDNTDSINYDDLFEKMYFRCVHVCCTNNIKNYETYGIMRPLVANDNEKFKINVLLKKIILKSLSDKKEYYEKQYDLVLEEEYKKNINCANDWYGKYSCVCYTLDDKHIINSNNSKYEQLIKCYGGEIFRDLGVPYEKTKIIAKNFKSYAIFFKLSYKEINCKCILISNIYKHMKNIYYNKKSQYGFENNINKDIMPSDFIEICEVK